MSVGLYKFVVFDIYIQQFSTVCYENSQKVFEYQKINHYHNAETIDLSFFKVTFKFLLSALTILIISALQKIKFHQKLTEHIMKSRQITNFFPVNQGTYVAPIL